MAEPKRRCPVTDREKLKLQIRHSTEYEFGTLCDFIDTLALADDVRSRLKTRIRNHGNNIIRITSNHLDSFNVTHRNTTPVDVDRIAARLQQKEDSSQ